MRIFVEIFTYLDFPSVVVDDVVVVVVVVVL
jgi:hypothetical protein